MSTGPSFAKELAQGLATAVVVASESEKLANEVWKFSFMYVCLYMYMYMYVCLYMYMYMVWKFSCVLVRIICIHTYV